MTERNDLLQRRKRFRVWERCVVYRFGEIDATSPEEAVTLAADLHDGEYHYLDDDHWEFDAVEQ